MVAPENDNKDYDADELYLNLRYTFLESLNSKGNYDDYEDIDIERIRNDDSYCKRFIRHKKGDMEQALLMVDETLKWRKSFGVKDVNQASFPADFFQTKAVYPFNEDIKGNPIILIITRFHKKAPEFAKELRRFVIYWVELMEEQTKGGHMTVIISCVGAGLSNLDLDLIKFLITLFRQYYPDSLAHILVYEMPWILSPAWKIIKAWLPEDFVEKIVFVSRTSIQSYISEENLPVEMGGTDATEYVPPTAEEIQKSVGNEQKRVHFSHDSESLANDVHTTVPNGIVRSSVDTPSHVLITDDYTIIGGILKISPATELSFLPHTESPTEVTIKLSCVSKNAISYKVKTNNIESYRVKPSIGIIEPGQDIEINVVLLSGFYPQPTDKFLIMSMEVSDAKISFSNLNALWKSSSSSIIADHKLKCILKKSEEIAPPKEITVDQAFNIINKCLSSLSDQVESMDRRIATLQSNQRLSFYIIIFIFVLLVFQCITQSNLSLPIFPFKYWR